MKLLRGWPSPEKWNVTAWYAIGIVVGPGTAGLAWELVGLVFSDEGQTLVEKSGFMRVHVA